MPPAVVVGPGSESSLLKNEKRKSKKFRRQLTRGIFRSTCHSQCDRRLKRKVLYVMMFEAALASSLWNPMHGQGYG